MITERYTDNFKILDSNVVLLPNNNSDLTLHFKFDDFEFDFQMIFVDDKEDESQRLKRETEGSLLKAVCFNFNNMFGTGTVTPLDIATIEGKKLYIHFWSYLQGIEEDDRQIRKVEYAVLLER